jgi:hypothetical protein
LNFNLVLISTQTRCQLLEKTLPILREVISDRKLAQAEQYVIYSGYAAICCCADGTRILATSVEPLTPVGNGWEAYTSLGPASYLLPGM